MYQILAHENTQIIKNIKTRVLMINIYTLHMLWMHITLLPFNFNGHFLSQIYLLKQPGSWKTDL